MLGVLRRLAIAVPLVLIVNSPIGAPLPHEGRAAPPSKLRCQPRPNPANPDHLRCK
uniref:Uncharacterized protein n=1 Tax=Setaria viridis TaxID=4556 RepID=A0A4U6TBK0_SETVI|nr:hypothetical protein SEVIR_9G581350v2 [Setaria viridis]